MKNILCIAFSVAVGLAPFAHAVCCSGNNGFRCWDNTQPTPCCGYGPCNVFCCNCDGGCRYPGGPGIFTSQETVAVTCPTMEEVSRTSTGVLTVGEYLDWAMKKHYRDGGSKGEFNASLWLDYFGSFDSAGKGYISWTEAQQKPAAHNGL